MPRSKVGIWRPTEEPLGTLAKRPFSSSLGKRQLHELAFTVHVEVDLKTAHGKCGRMPTCGLTPAEMACFGSGHLEAKFTSFERLVRFRSFKRLSTALNVPSTLRAIPARLHAREARSEPLEPKEWPSV